MSAIAWFLKRESTHCVAVAESKRLKVYLEVHRAVPPQLRPPPRLLLLLGRFSSLFRVRPTERLARRDTQPRRRPPVSCLRVLPLCATLTLLLASQRPLALDSRLPRTLEHLAHRGALSTRLDEVARGEALVRREEGRRSAVEQVRCDGNVVVLHAPVERGPARCETELGEKCSRRGPARE